MNNSCSFALFGTRPASVRRGRILFCFHVIAAAALHRMCNANILLLLRDTHKTNGISIKRHFPSHRDLRELNVLYNFSQTVPNRDFLTRAQSRLFSIRLPFPLKFINNQKNQHEKINNNKYLQSHNNFNFIDLFPLFILQNCSTNGTSHFNKM